jgi:hypothetical protein
MPVIEIPQEIPKEQDKILAKSINIGGTIESHTISISNSEIYKETFNAQKEHPPLINNPENRSNISEKHVGSNSEEKISEEHVGSELKEEKEFSEKTSSSNLKENFFTFKQKQELNTYDLKIKMKEWKKLRLADRDIIEYLLEYLYKTIKEEDAEQFDIISDYLDEVKDQLDEDDEELSDLINDTINAYCQEQDENSQQNEEEESDEECGNLLQLKGPKTEDEDIEDPEDLPQIFEETVEEEDNNDNRNAFIKFMWEDNENDEDLDDDFWDKCKRENKKEKKEIKDWKKKQFEKECIKYNEEEKRKQEERHEKIVKGEVQRMPRENYNQIIEDDIQKVFMDEDGLKIDQWVLPEGIIQKQYFDETFEKSDAQKTYEELIYMLDFTPKEKEELIENENEISLLNLYNLKERKIKKLENLIQQNIQTDKLKNRKEVWQKQEDDLLDIKSIILDVWKVDGQREKKYANKNYMEKIIIDFEFSMIMNYYKLKKEKIIEEENRTSR